MDAESPHRRNSCKRRNTHQDAFLSSLKLPCGKVVQNRFVKAATYEHLASYFGGPPNEEHLQLYRRWSRGHWGMVITGNVQVSPRHLTLGADMVVPEVLSAESMAPWKVLARAMKGEMDGLDEPRPFAIMQLSHAGRQSTNFIGGRMPFVPPLAPSSIRLGSTSKDGYIARVLYRILFQTPRAMSKTDIEDVVACFVRGARLASESGFNGVQLHAAHGYLISQFILRKTNVRQDDFRSPLAFLETIVRRIREVVPSDFALGIKLNAGDYIGGELGEDAKNHLLEIASWGLVDWIEISGGDYENPDFMAKSDNSTRQAFFAKFSKMAMELYSSNEASSSPRPLVMLTGGLRTRAQFTSAIRNGDAHLLGLARHAISQPDLPLLLEKHSNIDDDEDLGDKIELGEGSTSPEPRSPTWWPRLVGAGIGMAWYTIGMRRIAVGKPLPIGRWWVLILLEMYFGELGVRIITSTLVSLLCIALYFLNKLII
ncbi:FMN-linked oxidoreductase [Schizopora paradoxa]|uniref:FMN-linked oxidoreductase n=1 Tax=Schizopora paradoxa TaxID=27342 RepID=A0A0H2RS14_9AGAM|nr:FMN-linked oxidoreductase [Schizopora paradoxa]